jgi:sulfate permease, SulP family
MFWLISCAIKQLKSVLVDIVCVLYYCCSYNILLLKKKSHIIIMENIFPFVKHVKKRGVMPVLKEACIPALAVTFMVVPQGLAYAILADMPPIYGLYSCTIPLIVYSILGTSGQIALGPVAMISLLTSGTIAAIPGGVAPEMVISLVHVLALLYGIASLVLGLLRLGSMTQFLSHEVLGGFTAAAAIIISFSQMKYVLGVKIARHHYPVQTIVEVFSKIPNTNLAEMFISFISVAIILLLRYWKKKNIGPDGKKKTKREVGKMFHIMSVVVRFSALIVVFIASGIAAIMVAAGVTINIVGVQPTGIPAPTIIFSSSTIATYIPSLALPAVTMAFIGFAETYAVGKVYDTRDGMLEPNQELIAIGTANIVGAFFNSIPVAGSFGRTAVNANAGSKSTISNLLTGLGVILILLFLSPIIQFVPYSALAAIIITSVTKLINLDAFKLAWRVNKADFAVLMTTLVGTLALGIELGIAVGTGVSLLNIIRESATPHVAILGQVNVATKGSDEPIQLQWRDVERFPEAYHPPSNIVIRIDRSLFFPNCEYFEARVMKAIKAVEDENTTNVVFDLKAVNKIDLSGLHMLVELQEKLQKLNIKLTFACGKGAVRDTLKRWTTATQHGSFTHFNTIEEALVVVTLVVSKDDGEKNILLEEDELRKGLTDTEEVKLDVMEVEKTDDE